MSGHTGKTKLKQHKGNDPAINSGPRSERKQTYLHPVGEPIAFRVCALHCEQNIAPRNDTPLWHCLDFNRQVSIIFLQEHTDKHKNSHSESDSHCGRYFSVAFFSSVPRWPEKVDEKRRHTFGGTKVSGAWMKYVESCGSGTVQHSSTKSGL